MDRTSQQPQQRDMVFCHQCENEWYRDEHGLTCPDCQSDFTEIIEANHDPREDDLHIPADAPDQQVAPHQHGEYYGGGGAPDPDEDDIDHIHWNQTGPGQFRGSVNRTISIDPRQPLQQQLQGQLQGLQGPQGQGGGLLNGLLGTINGMLGGLGEQQGQQQGQQPGQQQPGYEQGLRPQSPDVEQGRSASVPGRGGSTVRTYHGPNFHMSVMTSGNGNLLPRNANTPQAFQPQPDHMEQMMAQMLANVGVFPGGPGGMHGGGGAPGMRGFHEPPPVAPMGPFGNIFHMLGMPGMGNGQFGDAVFSQEALDRVMTQLMEQHQAGNAPGPASDAAIKSLPTRQIEITDLGETGKAECTICMDEVDVGSTVTVLPCSHWFHADCIKAWLSEHDTCPHCRQGIMPKEESNPDRPRQPSQAPLNDMHAPEYHGPRDMPGGFPTFSRQESGSQEHPFTVPESPTMHRRSSSTPGRPGESRQGSAAGGSGMFQRMRSAFSNDNNAASGSSGDNGQASKGRGPS
ncbi:hypothetical protein B0A55_04591 [Friedmanniomyces simplex]|uniref:RING-type E3 ubiquitin transferase n=1 Tax=Friedmanniomyces simplex TaxID=329884 RepID=A0A4U0XSB5_9PEZI|nr:hypothetical protein B0A55_04591 [Friedmanniomyces simplex]